MKNALRTVVVLALVALIAAPLAAQDEGKKKKGNRSPREMGGVAQIQKNLEQLDLSAEQKEKINAIFATYRPKLEQAAGAIKITPEQQRAAAEARKAAVAEGKKGKEVQEASQAAMKLSDDQISARKKQQEMMQELRKEITAVLTAEQQEKFRAPKDGEGKKSRKKK